MYSVDTSGGVITRNYIGYNYPLDSNAQPGNGGFSWIVKILPYMEENALYDSVNSTSNRFQLADSSGSPIARGAFNPAIVVTDVAAVAAGENPGHASTAPIGPLQCPSFAGDDEAGWQGYESGTNPTSNASTGNYVAMVGTHAKQTADTNGYTIQENGAIISGRVNRGRGTGIGDLRDGVSKTITISESKEEDFASWYCGESAWVLAFAPWDGQGQFDILQNTPRTAEGLYDIAGLNSYLGLNFGPDAASAAANPSGEPNRYWSTYAASGDHRDWGPSSEHSGGVVIHSYGDGHTQSIPSSIDPNVFYALCTRASGESVDASQ
jgi:hypothetical protein